MPRIAIGDAVWAGFGLIRARPASVIVWGALQTALILCGVALVMPGYEAMMTRIIANAGRPPDVTQSLAQMNEMMGLQGVSSLVNLLSLFSSAMLYCAIYRAVIHPDRGRYFYLRVGMSELSLFVVLFAEVLVFVIGAFIAMIPAVIVIALLAASKATAAAVIVGILLAVALAWAMIFFGLRLSMIGPMLVDTGKFDLGQAWRLTRGHTGALFLIALCVALVLLVCEILVAILFVAIGAGLFAAGLGGDMTNAAVLMKTNPAAIVTHVLPVLAVLGVLAAPLYGLAFAIMGAPYARAYLDLRGQPVDVF